MNFATNRHVQELLNVIYGPQSGHALDILSGRIRDTVAELPRQNRREFSARDILLITYGDQIQSPGHTPLATLCRFLCDHELQRCLSTVHILPFFPYSSDDGFSVIDYRRVDPKLGDWRDIERIGKQFRLMFDLVLNHISRHSEWFQAYQRGETPFVDFFLEVDPQADVSQVVRPRSLPLLTPVETTRGQRHVWTTFSDDQIDLDFANPAVLAEMTDILLSYVRHGAQMIRLDAVGFLWKRLGTSCIHLPETHAVVKLMRCVLEAFAPHVWLLTETNVPHDENIRYFGDADEAQLVYQFSLPPLLLDAFLHQDATPLQSWLERLAPTAPGTTFLNFTASHDGIGVRPLEGLVSPDRLQSLVAAVRARGGLVSTRRTADGRDRPYELNISYFDALGEPRPMPAELHLRRFLSTQAIMLALRGIPAVYFHSLVGTPNDQAGVASSGQNRRINRRRYEWDELAEKLRDPRSLQRHVFLAYQRMLATRAAQPAFAPDASQACPIQLPPWLLAFERFDHDSGQAIGVLTNVSQESRRITLNRLFPQRRFVDNLLMGIIPDQEETIVHEGTIVLKSYETVWLTEGEPNENDEFP